MSEPGNEGNATPRGLVTSVIRALSATMASGGNRNSRLTVASSDENVQSQDKTKSDDLEERRAEIRYAEQYARRNLDPVESHPTNYPDARALREETLSLMTSLHQSHLDELEQQRVSQKSPDVLAHSGDLFSSSAADPVFVPRLTIEEDRSFAFRPAPSLTPFSNPLNPGLQLYESVERKARGGIDNG